jgi:2-amino-4-hydroxy-6-hydroxymethyldihydropteridine diphosphokinase
MARVYVGLGSNIDRETNVRNGTKALETNFGELIVSSVYESKAFGFDGENFFNLVVGFDTSLSLPEVLSTLHEIEYQFGRQRNEQRFLSRTLDLDLLLFGDLVQHDEEYDLPREDVTCYAFVLCPLAEIAGDVSHPETGQSFSELWQAFDKSSHDLWTVDLL